MTKITLAIDGMHCDMCSAVLQQEFNSTDGIYNAVVSIDTNQATMEYDEKTVSRDTIIKIVENAGYSALAVTEQKNNRVITAKKRFIISAAFSLPLLLTAMLTMLGFVPVKYAFLYALLQLVLCIPVVVCGLKIYINGFIQLAKLKPDMDTLVAVATTSAFAFSIYCFFKILLGNDLYVYNLYFGSIALIITLILLGKAAENEQVSKTSVVKHVRKISMIFVFAGIAIAAAAFYMWFALTFSFAVSFKIFVSVLIIACPCSLSFAISSAIKMGTDKASQNGILFKNIESLETASKSKIVVINKAGTLTEGKPAVTDVIYTDTGEEELIKIAASLEKYSQHPLAKAIVKLANDKEIETLDATDVKSVPGQGIMGVINGKLIKIGNIAFTGAADNKVSKQLLHDGKTLIYITADDEIKGIFAFSDALRPDSISAIAELEKLGLRTVMLTGDNAVTASAVASKLSIDSVYAQVVPDEKILYVKKIMNYGQKVIMISDKANEKAALLQADVGIAMGEDTESADIVLSNNSISDVVKAVKISRAVIRCIKQNIFWAFIFNCLGIPVAMGFFISLGGSLLNSMSANLAIILSAVFVSINSLRLYKIKI